MRLDCRARSQREYCLWLDGATDTESDRISDSRFCSQCNAPLEYDYVQYGQLGAYHCPSCGWARPALVRRVTGVELGCDGYGFDLVFGSAPDAAAVHIATRYNGLYMVYNVAAAFFAAHELGVDTARLQPTLDATCQQVVAWAVGISPAEPSRPIWPKIP